MLVKKVLSMPVSMENSIIYLIFSMQGIKLQMRRPLDSEIIKLNIIEIYGSTVFPIEKNSLRLECNSRFVNYLFMLIDD